MGFANEIDEGIYLVKKNMFKIAAGAAIVVGLVGAGSPAFADQGSAYVGSQAYYKTSGKVLSATDTDSDGKSAIAEIQFNGSIIKRVTNGGGKGTTKSASVDVPSGRSISIRACVQDQSGGGAKSCSAWKGTTS